MILKRGVILDGVRTEMMVAIGWIGAAYAQAGKDCVLTSAKDSVHQEGSKHYSGGAVDFRTRHLSGEEKGKILAFCKAKLDPLGYDTMIHGPVEHLHCEFDPKAGEQLWRREG